MPSLVTRVRVWKSRVHLWSTPRLRTASPCAAGICLIWPVAKGLQRKPDIQWTGCSLWICSRITWENIPVFQLGTSPFAIQSLYLLLHCVSRLLSGPRPSPTSCLLHFCHTAEKQSTAWRSVRPPVPPALTSLMPIRVANLVTNSKRSF